MKEDGGQQPVAEPRWRNPALRAALEAYVTTALRLLERRFEHSPAEFVVLDRQVWEPGEDSTTFLRRTRRTVWWGAALESELHGSREYARSLAELNADPHLSRQIDALVGTSLMMHTLQTRELLGGVVARLVADLGSFSFDVAAFENSYRRLETDLYEPEAEFVVPETVALCGQRVIGVDVHPVAVIIARVTYLLALGEGRLRERAPVSVPVYLGDSLQWNTQTFLAEREVLVGVPEGPTLFFPFAVTRDPSLFDSVVDAMLEFSERQALATAFRAWLERRGIGDVKDLGHLVETYDAIRALHASGRDHIWGYIARNLSRPIWLSSDPQRADVVVGNPPWLSYRYMAPEMQTRFRAESQRLGVWVGGRGRVSHQDLSAYFFARCAELYLKPGAMIALVMPYAALSRHHFAKFRTGSFSSEQRPVKGRKVLRLFARVRYVEAWAFDEGVQPLFPVPSCVLFAQGDETGALPETVTAHAGSLPRRDATVAEASAAIETRQSPWPTASTGEEQSAYRAEFRAGAIVFPRVLFVVERAERGRLGVDPSAPFVRSRRTSLEKPPWKDLPALEGVVEAEFLRPPYLGESVIPYRLLEPTLAVIPWHEHRGLLDREVATELGYLHLGRWLTAVEVAWREHGKRAERLVPRLDYFHQLSAQLPPPPVRVIFAASGTLPAAAVLRHPTALVEHGLYWTACGDAEALYLAAVLNSEAARAKAADRQSRGQWGARHFDKVMLGLPVPKFDSADQLHQALVEASQGAEAVAAGALLPAGVRFVRARQLIRDALRATGIAQRIDELVGELLAESR